MIRSITFASLAVLASTATASAKDLLDQHCLIIGFYLDERELFAENVALYYDAALAAFTADQPSDQRLDKVFKLIDYCTDNLGQDLTIRQAMAKIDKTD